MIASNVPCYMQISLDGQGRQGEAVGRQSVTKASLKAPDSRSRGRGGPAPNSNPLLASSLGYLMVDLDWLVNAVVQS
jgi:hypothetical protein